MPTYIATIRHHSLAEAAEITITGPLTVAKKAATRRFGGGFRDHEIIISTPDGEIVARRQISERNWIDQ